MDIIHNINELLLVFTSTQVTSESNGNSVMKPATQKTKTV